MFDRLVGVDVTSLVLVIIGRIVNHVGPFAFGSDLVGLKNPVAAQVRHGRQDVLSFEVD